MIKLLHDRLDKIDMRETVRYLGIRGDADVLTQELFCACEAEVLREHALSACYELYPVIRRGTSLDLGFTTVESCDLYRNLEGCGRVILFACTAGLGIDRLIAKYKLLSPARASMLQAMGAAAVESFCDILCARFKEEYGATKPRFSCGFGDLPLTLQRDIFKALDVTKNIGITLSDDCFMTPTKSVTALVGILGDNA